METKIVTLRKEVKNGKTVQIYANSSNTLDKLINNQLSYRGKTGIGYKEKFEKNSSPSMTIKEDGYAKSTKKIDISAKSRDQGT